MVARHCGVGTAGVTSKELFVGLLLAHPDPRGEVWQLLDYIGLTARDLLPDDYPVIDGLVASYRVRTLDLPEALRLRRVNLSGRVLWLVWIIPTASTRERISLHL